MSDGWCASLLSVTVAQSRALSRILDTLDVFYDFDRAKAAAAAAAAASAGKNKGGATGIKPLEAYSISWLPSYPDEDPTLIRRCAPPARDVDGGGGGGGGVELEISGPAALLRLVRPRYYH